MFARGSLLMTSENSTSNPFSLAELGFSPYFVSQLSCEELELQQPMRIVEVQRNRFVRLR